MTRICVFGAGGVGSYLAGTLSRAGRDVSVVARGDHLARIRDHGLTVRDASDQFTVQLPASNRIATLGQFDIVIVTAKAPAIAAIAADISAHVEDHTAVLFATNGVQWFYADGFVPTDTPLDTRRLDRTGDIHRLIGAERSFGVVVRSSNIVVEPGVIFNAGGGRYELGSALQSNASWGQSLVEALNVSGAIFSWTDDIRREMWKKLIRNAAVALLCGLSHATPGDAFSGSHTASLALAIMQEVAGIAETHGFRELIDLEPEMDVVGKMTAMKPSIVQDLELGRSVELDAQVLILLDFARQAGLDVPVLATLAPVLELKARLVGCYE